MPNKDELLSIAKQAVAEGDDATAHKAMDMIDQLGQPSKGSSRLESSKDLLARNLRKAGDAIMDAGVGKAMEFGDIVYDTTASLMPGPVEAVVRGGGRGIGNVVEGTSQALYDVGGQLAGVDTSRQLNNIAENRQASDQLLAKVKAEYPMTTATGQFIGNVAPFMVSPASLPGLLASGTVMGATQYQDNTNKDERNVDRMIDTLVGAAAAPLGAIGTRATINNTNRGIREAMDTLRRKVDDVSNVPSFLQRPTKGMAKVANIMEDIQGALTGGKLGIAPESKTAVRKAAQSHTEALNQLGLDFGGSLVRPIKGPASAASYLPTAVADLISFGTGMGVPVVSLLKMGSNVKPVREVRAALRQGDSLEQVGPLMKELPSRTSMAVTELLTGQSK